MPKSEQDEKRLKEIDSELEEIHNNIKEYLSRRDKFGVIYQTPGRPREYDKLVDRESELLRERKSIVERS